MSQAEVIQLERCDMVRLTKIYTRGGDGGLTSLASGERRPKHDFRVAAYGAVDEAMSAIGVARLHTEGELDAMLARIQNDLFDVGADLATPPKEGEDQPSGLRVVDAQVDRLEQEIDGLNANLAPLNSFVCQVGRLLVRICTWPARLTRRAEREATRLAAEEPVSPPAIKYLNRLSDLLFQMARHANDDGANDVLWVPGANR